MQSSLAANAAAFALVTLAVALAACTDEPTTPPEVPSPLLLDAQGRVTPLVCPGAPSCAAVTGALRVGVAARNITPLVEPWEETTGNMMRDEREPFEDLNGNGRWDPVWLAGFGVARAAREVHDDVWARALTFSQGDLRVGVVSLDLVGYFHDGILRVRLEALARKLDLDHIIVASTHQHEGPDTMGLWGVVPLIRSIDEAYLARVEAACVDALADAIAAERVATVTVAQGDATPLVADSRIPQVIDGAFTVLRFTDPAGAVFATWTIWGNHPEALDGDNQAVTSDYPHYTRARLEAEYPGSTAVFSAGSLGGLMNPLHIVGCPDAEGRATCRPGEWALADYIGTGLADRAVRALGSSVAVSLDSPQLAVRRRSFMMTTGNGGFATALALDVFDRQLFWPDGRPYTFNEARQVTMVDALEGRALIQTEVGMLALGPLEVLFVPGELYPELWLASPSGASFAEAPEGGDYPDAPIEPALVSFLSRDGIHAIVNQANDSLGYIMPKSQYDQEPPYAYGRSSPQYGELNSNGPDTAPALHQAVRELMQ